MRYTLLLPYFFFFHTLYYQHAMYQAITLNPLAHPIPMASLVSLSFFLCLTYTMIGFKIAGLNRL